jgi:hypothetical protein
MPANKLINFIYILSLLLASCSTRVTKMSDKKDFSSERFRIDPSQNEIKTYCTCNDLQERTLSKFKLGEIICSKHILQHKSGYHIKIIYKVIDGNSNDSYERGHWELQVFKQNKLIKKINMRQNDDPAWFDVMFVRIRKKQYFADINDDGFDEFAIFPYSPGSASFGTLRIFTLQNGVFEQGTAKYHIEGDGYALFNCPKCSKLNFEECKKCR